MPHAGICVGGAGRPASPPRFRGIARAKRIHPNPDGSWYLFLDEVTSVPDWQKGIKVAWDQGLTRNDFLLATGSSAHDIITGAEQLPGRRGEGADFIHLPMSFRDFCQQVDGIRLPAGLESIDAVLQPVAQRTIRETYLLHAKVERAFTRYLGVGGYPVAVSDYIRSNGQTVTPRSVQVLWNAIAGDVARAGRDQTATAKLLEEISVSLGRLIRPGWVRKMLLSSRA